MKRFIAVLVFLIVMLLAGNSVAQNFSDKEDNAVVLDEMVVTASRLEEAVSEVPANVSVVTAAEIDDATARNVADLLRSETGVHVTDITGNRRNYTVDLRGFGEAAALNTLVLVDGRRTNQADLSGTDWTQIPLARVARIEVIRGSRASVLYGDNAAGGVINIITRKGKQNEIGGEAYVGSYSTYGMSAYADGTAGALSYALSGSYLDTEGYRDNSENEVKDFGVDLGYATGDVFSLNLSSGYHDDTAGLPGAIKETEFESGTDRKDSVNPDDFADYEDYYIKVGPEFYFGENGTIRVDAAHRSRNTVSYSTFSGGYFTGETEIRTVTATPQMTLEEMVFGFLHSLNIGMDYTKATEDITNTSEFFGFLSTGEFDLEKENFGYYIYDALTVTPEFTVSAGYRYDTAEYTFATSMGEVDPNQTDFDESLFTAGVNYRFKPASNFYISYAKGYRYPVLDEIFNFFTNAIDPTITPQSSSDYEVGIRLGLGEKTDVGVNLFYVETSDEIFYNPDMFMNMNMDGDTIRRGIELTADRNVPWGRVGVNYTYTEAEIDDGMYDGSDIPNVPAHQAGFDLLIDCWKPLSMALNGDYVGERAFISDWGNTYGEHEDYFVMNAKLKYTWNNATAFVDINNLLNTEYEEYGVLGGFPSEKAYYPSPEMNFLAGVSVNF